jgi:hypothetical protein
VLNCEFCVTVLDNWAPRLVELLLDAQEFVFDAEVVLLVLLLFPEILFANLLKTLPVEGIVL